MFHRPTFPQVPFRHKHIMSMRSCTPNRSIVFLHQTDLWKFQSRRRVMSPVLPSSSFISSCLLGGLIRHTDPELPSMLAVTMSSQLYKVINCMATCGHITVLDTNGKAECSFQQRLVRLLSYPLSLSKNLIFQLAFRLLKKISL